MEDLLTYSKYEEVLCIGIPNDLQCIIANFFSPVYYIAMLDPVFDENEVLFIYRSSNRVIEMELLADFPEEVVPDKTSQSLLKEYLDAYSKEQNQQTEEEKHSVLIVQQYTRQLGRDLLRDEKAIFEECQFLFCVPLGWTYSKYEDALRALFMETEWITQNDPKNRLIFSPFIESVCQSLIARDFTNFGREKKYLYLYLDKAAIHLLSFQMQSAKELITVSKKLAASDFFLIPTDLGDSVSIHFTEIDVLIYNSTKRIIIRNIKSRIQKKRFYKKGSFKLKNGNKKTTQKQHSNINAEVQSLFSETSLHQTIQHIVDKLYEISDTDMNKPLHTSLYDSEGCEEILRGLTWGAFMHKLLTDANIKGIIVQLLCEVKRIYGKYSKFQDSPDGIQDVILHCNTETSYFCREVFQTALLDVNFVDPESDFFETERQDICHGAMQKPFKMIQIANALLPPIVWNEGTSRQVELIDYSNQKEDLLPPNSFYVQAYVNDGYIRFILNKVVAVSLLNSAMQKSTFTIQEVSVKLESTFDSVCDNMWSHLMSLDCLTDIALHGHCNTHVKDGYSTADYHFFKCSMTRMTEELLYGNFAKCNQDIDISHAIPISKECNCSFQISFRALINIGLQPVIIHIATIIASSLASSSFFGRYTVSALIIMDDSKETFLKDYHDDFKKAIQSCLKAHYKRIIIFYNREAVVACQSLGSWCAGLQQVFGKGTYSQVSSTDYILRFSSSVADYILRFSRSVADDYEGFGMYKYHSNSLKKGGFIERPNQFVVLGKGQTLNPRGSTHVFYQRNRSLTRIKLELFTINRHKDKVSYYRVWRQYFDYVNLVHPFTVRVTPQHHSSTIEFELSYLKSYPTDCLAFDSFSIQEKLNLR